MGKLTKTDAYSVVYGEYDEEKDKELFRCPRENRGNKPSGICKQLKGFSRLGAGRKH